MTDASDSELLAQFARDDSEAAFAMLVERHLALVHSTALRHTASPQHAQDIAQAVFIILARKACSLEPKTVLAGWLYQTTRLTAANFQRAEARRIRREQEVFMQSTLAETAPDPVWRELSAQLDEAMTHLGTTDRDALVLRYFQNKSLTEVGAALGLEERAAQKRVNRAVEKLRIFLAKRGVTLTAAALANAVATNSVQAAPAGLAVTVTTAAVKGASISATMTTLIKGTMKTMTWLKLKFAIGVGVAALLAGGVATVALSQTGTGDKLILNKVVAANRLWLLAPPTTVRKYSYVFHLAWDKAPGGVLLTPIQVANPPKALPPERQGITYASLLQRLAKNPGQVRVQSAKEENGKIRLALKILPAPGAKKTEVVDGISYPIPPLEMEYGNGLTGQFRGYYKTGGTNAELVIDAAKMVPLSAVVEVSNGTVEETFSDYAEVNPGNYVPLSVVVKSTGLSRAWEVAWKFKLHDGLWLFDESQYHGKKAAWTDQVLVN